MNQKQGSKSSTKIRTSLKMGEYGIGVNMDMLGKRVLLKGKGGGGCCCCCCCCCCGGASDIEKN